MAEQEHNKPTIVIKRVKKITAGAHGGSWKVAYADFMTAMMAFFLLMWLLNMVPADKKEELAAYFNDFSIFQNPGPSATALSSGGLGPPGAIVGSQAERPDVAIDQGGQSPGGLGQDQGQGPSAKAGQGPGGGQGQSPEQAAKALEQQIQKQLQQSVPELAGQVSVTDQGSRVRVEIMDKADRPLFDSGSVALLPDARRILTAITAVIKKEGVKVAIEGDTDAYKYSGDYTNWDLSTERALSARRFMVQDGLPPANVAEVTGYADTRPYVAGKPLDPKNRRISLLLFREPKPGETPADQGPGQPAVKPAAPKPPNVGEVLERQIDQLYDKSTESQF